MKRLFLLLLLAFTLFAAPVKRGLVETVERSFDKRLQRLFPGEQYLLLGFTQGFYLENVGCIFTARVNLAEGPTVTPFRPELTTEMKQALRQKKVDRLPVLRNALREMMVDTASTMDPLPPDQMIVICISLFHTKDEDTTGLPSKIVMQATRKALNASQAAAIQIQEF